MKREYLSSLAIAKAVIRVGIASLGLTQKRSPNLRTSSRLLADAAPAVANAISFAPAVVAPNPKTGLFPGALSLRKINVFGITGPTI